MAIGVLINVFTLAGTLKPLNDDAVDVPTVSVCVVEAVPVVFSRASAYCVRPERLQYACCAVPEGSDTLKYLSLTSPMRAPSGNSPTFDCVNPADGAAEEKKTKHDITATASATIPERRTIFDVFTFGMFMPLPEEISFLIPPKEPCC